ncbi:MAG: hypothetical protein EOS31_12300 [Mesorhizobium sp.]|uniref:transcriptional repressor TraM n=1 Tax=Mesorhizobium sp. TaxID=1871066 RepID=UPI000FCC6F66|nr:hypothetical protein EOA37_34060 [Mesorhizobium sp. M2A.F.Ca.ET.015.02.1.1]RVC93659.1 hypothetical protein EN753_33615 [Mesorhizobium sp. M2A.F.Ca.ET.029.05.1.1]RWC83373.1 MAG: hypothetical protein EOS31_12300 [Mesorhizobium sp.]RWF55699.1 MAG: hypothetical protein EOS66_12515 [Mesorhizobium sp.]
MCSRSKTITLRPVIGLTESLAKRNLEEITIEAIRTHRRLRDAAKARYEEWR